MARDLTRKFIFCLTFTLVTSACSAFFVSVRKAHSFRNRPLRTTNAQHLKNRIRRLPSALFNSHSPDLENEKEPEDDGTAEEDTILDSSMNDAEADSDVLDIVSTLYEDEAGGVTDNIEDSDADVLEIAASLPLRSDNSTLVTDAEIASIPSSEQSEPASEATLANIDMGMELGLRKEVEKRDLLNPYVSGISALSASEMINRFVADSSPRVQQAMKSTVMGLIGNIDNFATNAETKTTTENLANLMFQLQMTGYMFANAEWRLSMTESLSGKMDLLESGEKVDLAEATRDKSKVIGNIKVSLTDGTLIDVEAESYVAELREEVNKLRRELARIKHNHEEAASKDLVTYINSLPRQQMKTLTGEVSQEVLGAMESLVKSMVHQISITTSGEEEENENSIVLKSQETLSNLCIGS
uniref:Uncharacterized protein n=1 Tax=Octactis speculum TaxID=3111310 RepID=A0A7S2GW20_9STRA|mmetsp:Transcript_58605/g.79930  ORF Transcript_58605/g.79930 Transcript_58605/m.79930 type:complete len:414 (+) Transcript_58605:21-1262(+)